MGEIKSVKVDNWGVFFLQKLQNFFNKTDYCDLTLQFNDNSQLKVHRLVLSACTDYFNILEIQSDVVDNTLLMPKDFQADVVVPIVNFMYTGTLEFEYNMYDKLFRTAREMNMTVLVKLLEAHRKSAPQARPIVLNKSIGQQRQGGPRPLPSAPPQTAFPARSNNVTERTYASNKKPAPVVRQIRSQPVQVSVPQQQKNVKYIHANNNNLLAKKMAFKDNVPETIAIVSNYRQTEIAKKSGPSRFDPTEEEIVPDSFDTFNTISYESTPLMKAEEKDDDDDEYEGEHSASSSTFEQLRKGYTNPNKRAASKVLQAPPAKKFNLQDVKEYTDAARLRKQLEVDDDDENAFDYDADTHFDDDDDAAATVTNVRSGKSSQNSSLKEDKSFDSSSITAKDDQIIVKDNSGSVHHAKIISEVLKKYPHLVKNNKNIKLKILQKNNSSPTSVTVQEQKPAVEIIKQEKVSPIKSQIKVEKEPVQLKLPVAFAQQKAAAAAAAAPAAPSSTGPKKIDSKTMHALIAKGAENMTGPWLCLRCGVGKRPISIPSYKSFRRHLIQVHKEKIDPRICEHCGWKATKKNDLVDHYLNKHNIKIKVETAVKNQPSTSKDESSPKVVVQHCIYCNKTFSKEILLYSHMKMMHKEKAREDGVLDFSDDDQEFYESDKYIPNAPNLATSQNEKIKILSNITLQPKGGMPFVLDTTTAQTISQLAKSSGPSESNLVKLEPSSEAEALSNVASGIATSLGLVDSSGVVLDDAHYHTEASQLLTEQYVHDDSVIEQNANDGDIITKLVTTDGEELSQFQKNEIISQIQRQTNITSDNVVMVLNQETFEHDEILTSSNQNIVVVYSQTENDDGTTTLTTVSSKTNESMEWQESEPQQTAEKSKSVGGNESLTKAENKKVEQKTETEKKNEEEKLKLISALEGDWSEEDEVEEAIVPSKSEVAKKSIPSPAKQEDENVDLIEKSIQETVADKNLKVDENAKAEKERTPEEIMSELLGVDKTDDEESEIKNEEDEADKPAGDKVATETNASKESDVKELTNILGEWSSESFDENKHDESEEVIEAIEETSAQTNGADDSSNSKLKDEEEEEDEEVITEIEGMEDEDDKDDSTIKPATTNTSTSSSTTAAVPQPKEDIKTLINDWEDDDL